MATAAATATTLTIALLVLVLLGMFVRSGRIARFSEALVGFGYGVLLLTAITSAGVDLVRAILIAIMVALAYPTLVVARQASSRISNTVRGLLALLLAAALLGLVAHFLSLIGWVGVPATVIAVAVAGAAISALGGPAGASRAAIWATWVTLVLAWLLVVLALVLAGPGNLASPLLEVGELPDGTFVAMALGVIAVAAADPLLRGSGEQQSQGFPVGSLVIAVALIGGILLAGVIMFGGSFQAPSIPLLIGFGFLPAAGIGTVLAIASFGLIALVPRYLAAAATLLGPTTEPTGSPSQDAGRMGVPATVAVIVAALVAAALAIGVRAPTVLLVVAALIGAAAISAAVAGARRGGHVIATLLGAGFGVVAVAFSGPAEFFSWSWSTCLGFVLAAVAGAAAATVVTVAASFADEAANGPSPEHSPEPDEQGAASDEPAPTDPL